MPRTRRLFIGLLVLLLAALAPATAAHAEAGSGQAAGLVGTWLISFADAPAPELIITFHADGTLVGSATPVHPPLGVEGPGVTAVFHSAFHGVWAQRGDRQYQATIVQLEYDQDGELLLIVTVDTRITLDPSGDRFTTRDTIEVRTPDGAVVFSEEDEAGVRGTRVRLRV